MQSSMRSEDDWLLQKFVQQGHHLKKDALELATKKFLIMPEFYEQWLNTYVERYAPVRTDSASSSAALEEQRLEFVEACKGLFSNDGGSEVKQVSKLETDLASAADDVFKVRDILLQACRALWKPRGFRGNKGEAMRDEDKARLRASLQSRLRELVITCLEKMSQSNVGDSILKLALDKVQALILDFESKESEEVSNAIAGRQWDRLKCLALDIEQRLGVEPGSHKIKSSTKEGAGTVQLIEMALTALGGKATTQQVHEWIESHPEAIANNPEIKINTGLGCSHSRSSKQKQTGQSKKDDARKWKAWQNTVCGRLSENFRKIKEENSSKVVWSLERLPTPVHPPARKRSVPEELLCPPKKKPVSDRQRDSNAT
eukprot:gnl/MRDRNA2_/MRDRNA2_66216_c0_seq1.p1 gnl/MRDRNA2_/MRDRNA2_66216_c0~~gnl/MRDRNA2_/MRDRNA2_66216_c0_seq1.p1  ORF type:complete len:373 (+),score=82.55 gnl/MRDRNA2_/MRDRNA2_66216_c0_seq1:144-1262(+)